MPIYFLTANKNKFREAREIIPELEQLDIELPEIQEIDSRKIIEVKLAEALKNHQGGFIVEDTSLSLKALNGLPGPLIKWFLATIGNDGLWKMAESFADFSAEAKTVIGYAENPADVHYFEGAIKGKIVAPRGAANFGWDPIFQPEGYAETFAEMTLAEKNKISMRRQAFEQLKNYLDDGKNLAEGGHSGLK
jgi:non-canonical purine NTP pyrophosphatase (RdgB/HAM1 family)